MLFFRPRSRAAVATTASPFSSDETLQRLQEENTWLKNYLGETLRELHFLQQQTHAQRKSA